MADTADIEKKSLEAHVELCAERYRMLELKVETVEKDIAEVVRIHGVQKAMAEFVPRLDIAVSKYLEEDPDHFGLL